MNTDINYIQYIIILIIVMDEIVDFLEYRGVLTYNNVLRQGFQKQIHALPSTFKAFITKFVKKNFCFFLFFTNVTNLYSLHYAKSIFRLLLKIN